MKQLTRSLSLSLALAIATGGSAWALGFRNADQGARATGQAEAFVAQADDASAIYYNPAGLTQVKGSQFTSGLYLNFPNAEFHPAGGGEIKARDDMYLLPHFYAASDFGAAKWRFGLGFNIPFGNSMTWGNDNQLSVLVDKSEMAVYALTPTVAYQINDQLSLGVGLNIYYGDLMSRFRYSFVPAANFEFKGDGMAVGATVGLLWKPHWRHSFGVVYRSPFKIDFEGNATVTPAILPDSGPSPANFEMDFPQSVAVGYAFRPTEKWKLEVDIEWTNWDTLNTVALHSPNPYVALDPRSNVAFNWKDSFFYEFGTEYQINDTWVVRAGYLFSENTVPTSTFGPNLPDSDRHVFSAGVGFRFKQLQIDLCYQYSLSTDRTVTGSTGSPYVDGEWSSHGHAIMTTSTFRF